MGEKGFEGTEHRSDSLEHAGEDAPRYAIDNPGLPPHRPRLADEDPKAAKRAERQVSVMFLISIVGTVLFFIGYFGVGRSATVRRSARSTCRTCCSAWAPPWPCSASASAWCTGPRP